MSKFLLVATFLFTVPALAMAAGLVPCGGPGEEPCQFCDIALLVENVFDWIVNISTILVALIIIGGGLRLAAASGEAGAMTKTRKFIATAVIGYIILLAAWFVVDFGLRLFVNATVYGNWSTDVIQCVAQPLTQSSGRSSAVPANNHALTPAGVANRVEGIRNSGVVQDHIDAGAEAAGLNRRSDVDALRALISQESGNCQNKVGPPTNYGTAYGCGQMLISTARGLDPSLEGLSDAEVANRLREDDAYAISLSAEYFSQLLDQYNGDRTLALAAYNGGGKANEPSVDCPGLKVWQCPWNEPGCYGTGRTDCARNEGFSSYEQTRTYVANINAITRAL